MKRVSVAVLGAIAVMTAVPFLGGAPVLAQLRVTGTTLAQNLRRQPQIQLRLLGEKKVVELDEQGKEKISWQALSGEQAVVNPGDVLRYSLSGANNSDRPVRNLVVTQPVPRGTVYELNSARVGANNGSKITYSIDNGTRFVEQPTVRVTLPNGRVETRPAPAQAYTHIRWNFGTSLNPEAVARASYQVKVQ